MINQLLLLPIFVPLVVGLLLFIIKRYQRMIAIFSLLLVGVISGYLAYQSAQQGVLVINFGGWNPPFGIQFAGDALSLSLSSVSLIITAFILLYGYHQAVEYNHKLPFILFLLVGVNGSFLTADIFNLYVQFEITLLSSFVLLAIGNKANQFKASMIYVVINVIGSWLFLLAIALIYRRFGTLSFAHLSERIQMAGVSNETVMISLLFLVVFSLKSALLLFMWLPTSYAVLSTENSAIFSALMTKVGVYAMIRIFSVVFSNHVAVTHHIILGMSMMTMLIGCMGVLTYRNIKYMMCYQVILSIGIIIFGLGIDNKTGITGAMLYLINDMIVKALLFLLTGTIINHLHLRNIKVSYGMIKYLPLLGTLFFLVTLTMGGVPPFGGFPGKLLLIQGGLQTGHYIGTVIMVLTSIVSMYTLLRMYINIFFGEEEKSRRVDKIGVHQYAAMIGLLLMSLAVSIFASPLIDLLHSVDVDTYVNTLMKEGK